MRKLFVLTLLAIATWATAQEKRFVIRGEMSSPILCYSNDSVREVRLEQLVDGLPVVVATAPVEGGKFVIEGIAPDMLGLYNITGFDNEEFDTLQYDCVYGALRSDAEGKLNALYRMEEMLMEEVAFIPMMQNDNPVIYNERIWLPTEEFITGVGYGTTQCTIENPGM